MDIIKYYDRLVECAISVIGDVDCSNNLISAYWPFIVSMYGIQYADGNIGIIDKPIVIVDDIMDIDNAMISTGPLGN